MNGRRSALRVVLPLLLIAVMCVGPADLQAQGYFKQPPANSVYKEYVQVIDANTNDWRVTDPNIDLGTFPAAGEFLPNPTLTIDIDDLQGAIRAEALFSLWGGHVATVEKRVSFNGNGWIGIPELATTPTDPLNYLYQSMVGVDVPLGHLVQGTNTFTGSNSGQTGPWGFGWGQFGWYAVIVRVYYDPGSKSHVTGSISSPGGGGTIGEYPTISVQVNGSASKVDVLAHYDGYDTDGDGVYLEYHHDYHRAAGDPVEIRNHVGTAYSAPFSVVWDNSWVGDQSGVKLLARIKGENGVWYVTPEVTGVTLARSVGSVVFYKPYGVGEVEQARGDLPRDGSSPVGTQRTFVDIGETGGASASVLFVRTWNSVDGNGDPEHYTRVNDWYAPGYGQKIGRAHV